MNITIRKDKAVTIAQLMNKFYKDKGVLRDAAVLLPDAVIVKGKEHIIYLFHSCILNYGMKSM